MNNNYQKMFNTIYSRLFVLKNVFEKRTQELECVLGHTYKMILFSNYHLRHFITLGI